MGFELRKLSHDEVNGWFVWLRQVPQDYWARTGTTFTNAFSEQFVENNKEYYAISVDGTPQLLVKLYWYQVGQVIISGYHRVWETDWRKDFRASAKECLLFILQQIHARCLEEQKKFLVVKPVNPRSTGVIKDICADLPSGYILDHVKSDCTVMFGIRE